MSKFAVTKHSEKEVSFRCAFCLKRFYNQCGACKFNYEIFNNQSQSLHIIEKLIDNQLQTALNIRYILSGDSDERRTRSDCDDSQHHSREARYTKSYSTRYDMAGQGNPMERFEEQRRVSCISYFIDIV